MRRLILKVLEPLCNVAIVLVVLGLTAQGASTGGFPGALAGFVVGFITCVIAFGALFLLMDIADNTKRTADSVGQGGVR